MVLTEFPFLQPWWSFRWRKWGGGVASLLLGFFCRGGGVGPRGSSVLVSVGVLWKVAAMSE